MSWQADIEKRYELARSLGVNLAEVDCELEDNDGWFDEDTAMTLLDAALDELQRRT